MSSVPVGSLRVGLGARGYDIHVGGQILEHLGPRLAKQHAGRKALVVTDSNVQPHAHAVVRSLAGFTPRLITLPPGEGQKSPGPLWSLYDALAEYSADRRTLVVAVGGGVIGDLAGFAAATFHRGLPLVMVPTTLLAMVDSSVGGKVGINHPRGKNLIGAFHQPVGVWIDTEVLGTLPDREYCSGLAEVVKYGVILDEAFFEWLEENAEAILQREAGIVGTLITRCCQLKAEVVEKDEYETTGLRAILNYGHTFGHAFEQVAGYGWLLHGEAVGLGMLCATRLAERVCAVAGKPPVAAELVARQQRLLERFHLPVEVDHAWSIRALLAAMRLDKKSQEGELRFVLPTRLGEVQAGVGVEESVVRELFRSLSLVE